MAPWEPDRDKLHPLSSMQESLSPALLPSSGPVDKPQPLDLAQPKEPVRVCWPQQPSRGDILASSWSVCMEARSTSLSYGVPSQPQATHFLLGYLPSESVPAFQRTPVIRVLSVLRGPCLQLVWAGGAGDLLLRLPRLPTAFWVGKGFRLQPIQHG